MGQVCAKHNEYYETECRYCEAPAAPTFPAFTWLGVPVAVDPTAKPITISGVLYSPCITSFPNDGHGSLE